MLAFAVVVPDPVGPVSDRLQLINLVVFTAYVAAGAEERFEYTVIGDPVNEAARWTLGDEVTLPGRTQATRLASPRRAERVPS